MQGFAIRPPEVADLAALETALATLSRELGDTHRAGVGALGKALFGTPPAAWGLLAEAAGGMAGVLLYAPVFSTVLGGAGLFVSDIWVDPEARGKGLGIALLHRAAESAAVLWDARFLRLSVHDDNASAREFYESIGFRPKGGETVMMLTGQEFQDLRRMT